MSAAVRSLVMPLGVLALAGSLLVGSGCVARDSREKPVLDSAGGTSPPPTSAVPTTLDAASLVRERSLALGEIGGRAFRATYGSLHDADFLSAARNGRNALVISQFNEYEHPKCQAASCIVGCADRLTALGRAVDDCLTPLSPRARERFLAAIESTAAGRPGEVVGVRLDLDPEARAAFPVDEVYVVLFQCGAWPDWKVESLRAGLGEVFRRAAAERVDTLVVPALTYNWEDGESVPLRDLYREVFDAAASCAKEGTVLLPLYDRWPTFVLEDAVGAIQETLGGGWGGAAEEPPG